MLGSSLGTAVSITSHGPTLPPKTTDQDSAEYGKPRTKSKEKLHDPIPRSPQALCVSGPKELLQVSSDPLPMRSSPEQPVALRAKIIFIEPAPGPGRNALADTFLVHAPQLAAAGHATRFA